MSTRPVQTQEAAPEPSGDFDRRALQMLHRVGGNRLVVEMVNLFSASGPERLATARAGLASSNGENVRAAAHALKSSAGQLGALRLQRMCAELESTVKESLTGAGARLDAIEVELARATRWLAQEAPSQ